MKAAILIVGSLLWDDSSNRAKWRRERLIIEGSVPSSTPIRYGRQSMSRGNTYTMVLDQDAEVGIAKLVPCRHPITNLNDLVKEACRLWKAERPVASSLEMAASWGCVGAQFRDDPSVRPLEQAWRSRYPKVISTPVAPVNQEGILDLNWVGESLPTGSPQPDLVLATATEPTRPAPTLRDISGAWANQHDGHEGYFFHNVESGIRTADDLEIWAHLHASHRGPEFSRKYSAAVSALNH